MGGNGRREEELLNSFTERRLSRYLCHLLSFLKREISKLSHEIYKLEKFLAEGEQSGVSIQGR